MTTEPDRLQAQPSDLPEALAMLAETRAALARERLRARLIAAATDEVVYDWDIASGRVEWNEGLGALFGYDEAEVAPHIDWWTARAHPDDLPRLVAGIERVIARGDARWVDEYRFRRRDGSYARVIDHGFIMVDAAGRPVRLVGTMQDITERKDAEEALARQAADLRALSEALRRRNEEVELEIAARTADLRQREAQLAEAQALAHMGSWEAELATGAIRWSDELYRIFGLPIGTVPHGPAELLNFVHPDDRERVAARVDAYRDRPAGAPLIQYRIVQPGGQVRHLLSHSRLVSDADGRPFRVYGMIQDVTTRVLAEEAQRESDERFRAAFERSPVGTALVSRHGRFLRVNPALCRITGYAEEEMLAMHVRDLTHPDDFATDRRRAAALLTGEQDAALDHKRYIRRDGAEIWVEVSASLVPGAEDEPAYFIAQIQDVTERVALQRAIAEQNEHLKQVDRLKSEFVSAVSHELRTPLTAIMGYAEFLEDEIGGSLTETQHQFVGHVQDGVRRLRRLVDDLLDFARMEAGTFRLEPAPGDLAALVRKELDRLAPLARERMIALESALPDGALPLVLDQARIGQVLTNLLGNAIKFTPPGGRVRVALSASPGSARVEVADSGRGIAPEHLPRLFEKFFQVDPSTTREHGGAGLGLAITKALVDAHGGAIGVSSRPGEGATFWFTLPRDPLPDPEPAAAPA